MNGKFDDRRPVGVSSNALLQWYEQQRAAHERDTANTRSFFGDIPSPDDGRANYEFGELAGRELVLRSFGELLIKQTAVS